MQPRNAIKKKKSQLNPKKRNLSYVEREMIINLYTSPILSYLKPLELKTCKGDKIRGIFKNEVL